MGREELVYWEKNLGMLCCSGCYRCEAKKMDGMGSRMERGGWSKALLDHTEEIYTHLLLHKI